MAQFSVQAMSQIQKCILNFEDQVQFNFSIKMKQKSRNIPILQLRQGPAQQKHSMLRFLTADIIYLKGKNMTEHSRSNNFIVKLHSILQNPSYQQIIRFDQTKTKIIVVDKDKIQAEILPSYFRHKNFSSFHRMLNLYGFKRVKSQENLVYTHSTMRKGQQFQSIVAKKKPKTGEQPELYSDQNPVSQQQIIRSSQFYLSAVQGKRMILRPTKVEPIENDLKFQEDQEANRNFNPYQKKKHCNLPSTRSYLDFAATKPFKCQPFIMNCLIPKPN